MHYYCTYNFLNTMSINVSTFSKYQIITSNYATSECRNNVQQIGKNIRSNFIIVYKIVFLQCFMLLYLINITNK